MRVEPSQWFPGAMTAAERVRQFGLLLKCKRAPVPSSWLLTVLEAYTRDTRDGPRGSLGARAWCVPSTTGSGVGLQPWGGADAVGPTATKADENRREGWRQQGAGTPCARLGRSGGARGD